MLSIKYSLMAMAVFVALALIHTHVILRRNPPVPHLLVLWLALGGGLGTVVFLMDPTHQLPAGLGNLAVYLFLGEVYLFIYSVAVGSVSVRLLIAIQQLEPAADALPRALGVHSPERLLETRLKSLVAQGLLHEHGGRYRPTPKGMRWARVGHVLKRILAVGDGG